MKISTTILLGFMLTGLGTYYYVTEKNIRQGALEAGPRRLFSLEAGDSISHLEIRNPELKEAVRLERQENGWQMISPVRGQAEDLLIEQMVSLLAAEQPLRRFPVQGDEWEEFGLGPRTPKLEVEVSTLQVPVSRALFLGKEAPIGRSVYARWEGGKECLLVPAEVKMMFQRSVHSLRQKSIFPVNWDTVSSLEIKLEGAKFRIEKSGEKWHWAEPAGLGEFSAEKMIDLIYAFRSLYIQEFLDGPETTERKFGFNAHDENHLALEGVSGGSVKLVLGARAAKDLAFYAYRVPEDGVFLVPEERVRSVVETLEVALHETKENGNSKTASGNSGKNQKPGPDGGARNG